MTKSCDKKFDKKSLCLKTFLLKIWLGKKFVIRKIHEETKFKTQKHKL